MVYPCSRVRAFLQQKYRAAYDKNGADETTLLPVDIVFLLFGDRRHGGGPRPVR